MQIRLIGILVVAVSLAACSDSNDSLPDTVDPGTGSWELVAAADVATECGLDPNLLKEADDILGVPWAVVRYGKLCHENYPDGTDEPSEIFSTTKTLAATVMGMVEYESRDFPRDGRKTGPMQDSDRIDYWLDDFSFNPDAQIAHVLGMVAFNEDLSWGNRIHSYDANGSREINRLSDVMNTVIAQDPERLGDNLEEFTQRFLFSRLGMTDSIWTAGGADKILAYTWRSTVRDMARLGLLILNDGVWNGERLLSAEWIDKMTHPAFEDANTSYGYLTWLSAKSNYHFGGILGGVKFPGPMDPCSPAAIWPTHGYPHGISEAADCTYTGPWSCEQEYDVGVWSALGAQGQLIVGHPALDLVILVKDLGGTAFWGQAWNPMRPALVALDPVYQGDDEAFCEDYGAGRYAPDLRP
ncbi:MAG: hypothetical protein ABGY42_16140 [bacterium]